VTKLKIYGGGMFLDTKDIAISDLKSYIENLRPFHVTVLENLIEILKRRGILSKRKLQEKNMKYIDLGEYPGKTESKRYIFYDFKFKDNRVEYSFRDASSIDLDEYVRFFIFIARNRLPKFVNRIWGKIQSGEISSKKALVFILLKKLKNIVNKVKSRYLIVYGPGAGYGQLFNDIEDFTIYVSIPSPDPLKPALRKLIVGKEAGISREYYNKILASEFCIKDECPLSLVNCIYIFVLKDNYDQVLKELIKVLPNICSQVTPIEENDMFIRLFGKKFRCYFTEEVGVEFYVKDINELSNISSVLGMYTVWL